jgi:hypothetical protein
MRGKKNKNSWVMGMPNESTYQVNGVTYIVASQFETRSEDSHTLRSRFERLIKNNSADLSEETKGDIITAEYVSAANPISDRKEQNAEENSSQTE